MWYCSLGHMSEEEKGTPCRRRRTAGVAVDWSVRSCLRGRLLANNPRCGVCRSCIESVESDGACVVVRVGVHRVCACCVELERRFVCVLGQVIGCVARFLGAWCRRCDGVSAMDREWGGRCQVSWRSGWLTIGDGRVARRSCVRARREFAGQGGLRRRGYKAWCNRVCKLTQQ
jgi:hypothetical protein